MADHPDAKPGLADFFAHLDSMHREFFSVVLREWGEYGQTWTWHEQGVSLCLRTAAGHVPLIHLLYGHARVPALLVVPLLELLPKLGQEEVDAMVHRFTSIHGLVWRRRQEALMLEAPAHASGPVQQAVRDVIKQLALRLPNLLAR